MCELVPCVRAMSMAKKYIAQSQTHDFEKEQPAAAAAAHKKVNQWFKTRTFMEATKTKNELPTECRVCNEFIIKYFAFFSICKIFKATVEAMNGVVN